MTEYEILDVINSVSSNLLAAQALFITIISAYLIVAYSAGKNLTVYQVSFVNFGFILFAIISINSALGLTDMIFVHYEKLVEIQGTKASESAGIEFVRAALITLRLLLVIGALVFMWQIRHPKTE